MPLPFKYTYHMLGEPKAQRIELDVTIDTILDLLKAECSRRPRQCHVHLVRLALCAADIQFSDCVLHHPIEEWFRAHCLKKFGTNWSMTADGIDGTLWSLLNYYVDKAEAVDTMFAREFEVPLFFDFVKDRVCTSQHCT